MSEPKRIRVASDTPDRDLFCRWLEGQGYEPAKNDGEVDAETAQRLWEQYCNLPAEAYDCMGTPLVAPYSLFYDDRTHDLPGAHTLYAAQEAAIAAIREAYDDPHQERSVLLRGVLVAPNGHGGTDELPIEVVVHPDEPACTEERHDWGDERVVGHGGGVVSTETCRHCGCRRATDTWPTDPETGEQGGWECVSYTEAGDQD